MFESVTDPSPVAACAGAGIRDTAAAITAMSG
jgi:hypothetical protein